MGELTRARMCRTIGGVLGSALACAVWGGGGPETTLLVVNARSPLSLAVANEYIRLRDLPERQVLWLDEVPPLETIDAGAFRLRILDPIRAHLARHGLADEIDLIAYSAGFPYAVNILGDLRARGLKPEPYRGDTGALTALTYFARQVQAGEVNYLFQGNRYFRRPATRMPVPPEMAGPDRLPQGAMVPAAFEASRGFRGRHRWADAAGGAPERYLLSAMLGYAGRGGNSLPEISTYLARAAASDGTQPAGTVYLMENRDIRGRARRHLFPAVMAELRARGRRAEVLVAGEGGQNGDEPRGKADVMGLVAGTQTVRWAKSNSRLLPGAVAESFTSYGGHFAAGMQTKLSEFLRHGAAGSSGAVREPYAFVEKFPVPQLHVYYADGCSLAEAFYQSVASPFQLIVVGDPLARPFAHFARVEAAVAVEGAWRGMVDLHPRVTPAAGRPIGRLELWVDGRPLDAAAPGQSMKLDTQVLADGWHELRVVAVEAGAIETRSYASRAFEVDNRGRRVVLMEAPSSVRIGAALELVGRSEGAVRISVRQGSRVLGRADVVDGRWSVRVASEALGFGGVALQAVAEYPDGGSARSPVHRLSVKEPLAVLRASAFPPAQAGLHAEGTLAGGGVVRGVIEELAGRAPRMFRGARYERIAVAGAFEVREQGVYELTIEADGRLSVEVGPTWRHELRVAPGDGGARFALALAPGWHRFALAVETPGGGDGRFPLVVLGGAEPAFALEGKRVGHDGPDAGAAEPR